jgi:hypothetical protein
VKPSKEYRITLRSIDLGAMEVVSTYEELQDYRKVGSPFSIPKAALVLAGFHPDFSTERFASLEAPSSFKTTTPSGFLLIIIYYILFRFIQINNRISHADTDLIVCIML